MTSAELGVWEMVRRYVYIRDKGRCRICGKVLLDQAYGYQIHHALHRMNNPTMKLNPDICLLICETCHQLDDTGDLLWMVKREIGEERFYELKRQAQQVGGYGVAESRERIKQLLREVGCG